MSPKSKHCSSNGARRVTAFLALLVLASTVLCGCTHVNPWERGVLADPVMQTDRDPLGTLFAEHMWFSREATYGGRGVGGGGCGCN